MIRFVFVRIVFPLIVFWIVRSVLYSLFSAARASTAPAKSDAAVSPGGELKRDPVCGTFVSTATSVSRSVGGQTVYFCSKECRDRFKAA